MGSEMCIRDRVMVVVRATWPGQDVEQTTFYVYADAAMKDRRHVFPADAGRGTAVMLLGPGEYYVMAIVDVNANKKADAGDGFGFYGVHSVSAEARPQPLRAYPKSRFDGRMRQSTAALQHSKRGSRHGNQTETHSDKLRAVREVPADRPGGG